jgi:hypothetical protein
MLVYQRPECYTENMSGKISFATLQKKYSGMYVLMDKPDGKIVAAARDLKKAFKAAEKKGYEYPAVQFVEPKGLKIYEATISLRT